MLKTIQIIALLQGCFVLFVLFVKRKDYKKTTFGLLFGGLISVLFFILGDDEYNLFVKGADFILFDSSFFVTFLFLFFRYYKNGKQKFDKRDYLFFLPNIVYFIIEGLEMLMSGENIIIQSFEVLIEWTYAIYLMLIVYSVITTKKKHWVVYFAIPIVIFFAFSSLNDILSTFGFFEISLLNDKNFNTYLLLIIAFLFYFITFKLLTKENQILPKKDSDKYKNSSLNPKLIEQYKTEIVSAMQIDKMYLSNKLSIQEVSKKLNIPRQYISEVLNMHMNTNFQDFINQYRVEEFIHRLKNDQNNHYTLLAIATDVGFSSKSSFNATFKKIKGLTPTQFKKTLIKTNE